MESTRGLTQFYKALGDETRLQLVILLTHQEPGHEICVGRLAQILEVTPSAVSQHLRVLKDLGLVQAERQGYRIHYHLDAKRLADYHRMIRGCLGAGFVLSVAGDVSIADIEEASTMGCSDSKCCCQCPETSEAQTEECSVEQTCCDGGAAETCCEDTAKSCCEDAAEGCCEDTAECCCEDAAEGCCEDTAECCCEDTAECCCEDAAEGCCEDTAEGCCDCGCQ